MTNGRQLEREIEGVVTAVLDTKSESMKNRLEGRLDALEQEKLDCQGKLLQEVIPYGDFDTALKNVFETIQDLSKTWIEGGLATKEVIQRLVFEPKLHYVKNEGFRKPDYTPLFGLFRGLKDEKDVLVDPSGIEPLTSTVPR